MQGHSKFLSIVAAALAVCVGQHAWGVAVPVMDFGFESVVTPVGLSTGPGSWNPGGDFSGGAGIYSPNPIIPDQDGSSVARLFVRNQLGSYGVQFQDLGIKIQEGTYIVNFKAAYEPNFEPTTAILYFNFESIGAAGEGDKTFLGGDAFVPGTFDSTAMSEQVASVTIGPGSSSIGKYLRFYALAGGSDSGVNTTDPRATYNIDDVRLSHAPLDGGDPVPIQVGDPSFEPKIWQTGSNENGSSGVYHHASQVFPNQQASQLGYLTARDVTGSFSALFQDVTTIAAGTYTMTVAAAVDPNFAPTSNNLLLNFEAVAANGTKSLLKQTVMPLSSVNSTSLTDLVANVMIPANSADIGKTLRLVLVNSGADAGTNAADPRATYLIDNVRLDFATSGGGFTADFTGDGKVDAADLTKWRMSVGLNAGADADADGDSDGADVLAWQRQLGSGTAVAVSAAVPEPTSTCLIVAAALALYIKNRNA